MTRKLAYVLSFLMVGLSAAAQQTQQDSLVILLSSKSAQMVDIRGASYRKVVGPARFLHNNTFLLCDTALWNVDTRIIEAWGNVSILQDETVLTSDKLTYLIDQDLAQFRGSVVQLQDKDHNLLRTRHLDYNTKDSVAVFQKGGAMRDKDGQIIESTKGTYDSKIKEFTFNTDVNMFTDSIFVKTTDLLYQSDLNLATFGKGTNAWQEDNMLSSEKGWYDRGRELFFFSDKVHVMSQDQEGWCDSLYFKRATSDVEMLGNAQVSDTTRNVFALAGKIEYLDTLSKVTLTRKPSVITQTQEQDGSTDTVYLGAERLVYYTRMMCDIDSLAVEAAKERLKNIETDPVGTFRKKAAEEAAKAAEEAAKNDPNQRSRERGLQQQKKKAENLKPEKPAEVPRDTAKNILKDSLAVKDSLMVADSLMTGDSLMVADSLMAMDSVKVLPPKDTTKIGFLEAIRDVRIFKKNMQVVCDSLLYSDLDSLARLFKEPLIWQEVTRQYSADSVSIVIRNGTMDKASLMSNAFIVIQEDSTHFDQIKGAEMLAYFDAKGGLKRFDVLGGASALFYIEENDALATVNKTDSKMLSATFKDGEIQRIYYFESPKNDAYPIVQMSQEDRTLKGFNWQPERRPADRDAVTPLSLRPSQRQSYSARPRAKFRQTDIYFPGYISDIYTQIRVRDSLKVVRARERAEEKRLAEEKARLDSIARRDSIALADSLFRIDSLATADSLKAARADSIAVADSIRKATADSIARADSIAAIGKVMTPEEIKAAIKAEKAQKRAQAKAAREEKKKKKQQEREARWAELDKRDAERKKARDEEKKEKEREKKRKALREAAEQERKDAEVLERYRQKYLRKKEKKSGVM